MKNPSVPFEFAPIGILKSCFKDKFGVPRQPGLAKHATGVIQLSSDPRLAIALRSLDQFSHIWLVFVFHQHGSKNWKPSIRPPRLGGAKKVGVLASRSPHRPNPIGISAVELVRIDLTAAGGPQIFVRGIDLVDGTPILDIKPYLSYADSIPEAAQGWATEPPEKFPVEFSSEAEKTILSFGGADFKELIREILELDPRPSFQKRQWPPTSEKSIGKRYGFSLHQHDVKWEVAAGRFIVTQVVPD